MSKLIIARQALQDLEEIKNYLYPKSPQAALHLMRLLVRTCKELNGTPWLGRFRDDIGEPNVRFYSTNGFVIAYLHDEQRVNILRVVHGSRDLTKIRWRSSPPQF